MALVALVMVVMLCLEKQLQELLTRDQEAAQAAPLLMAEALAVQA